MFKNDSLKSFFDERTVKTIAISAVTVVLILAITLGAVWHNRARLFKYFAASYAAQTLAESEHASKAEALGLPVPSSALPDLPAVFSDQQLVENAVEKANPAVVAITISKTVPKYTTSYQQVDPFQNFFGNGTNPFGNFNIQVPVQTPNGTQEQEVGAGSGFLISADGLIVTNKHVVADTAAKYTVHLSNGKTYTATVLARDGVLDVALVKISASGLPYLTLADSSALKLGQSVIAIGNALGQFQNTVSVGVVSGLSRSITAGDGGGMSEALDHVIQTDAAINPGNSGGPLLDLNGHVVGVDTAIVQGSQNIGFALPINTIKTVIDSVKATGKIVRPYIGIRYVSITPELKDANNLTVDYGVLVKGDASKNQLAVIPASPADKAGIVENDIILEVNGIKIDNDSDFAQIIRQHHVGESITLTVLSKGVQKKVTIVLDAAPQD